MPKTTPENKLSSTRIYADLNDIEVAAEWLASVRAGECTSAQHEAIAHQLLERLVLCFAIDYKLHSKSFTAIYKHAASAHKQTHTLPKSKHAK